MATQDQIINALVQGSWQRKIKKSYPSTVCKYVDARPLPFMLPKGATVLNGSGMLLGQGALAFELWTGRPALVEVMRKALE